MMVTIAAWAWLLAPVPATAQVVPTVPELNLVEMSGEVGIRTAGESRVASAVSALPLSIPPASQVTVWSGTAVFRAGEVSIRAVQGDSFAFGFVLDGDRVGFRLAATQSSEGIVLGVRDAVVRLPAESAVAMVVVDGRFQIQSQAGPVTVVSADRPRVLVPGQIEILPAEKPLVEPGEELRSAVGAKRPGPDPTKPAENPGCWSVDPRVGPGPQKVCGQR